MSVIDEIIAPFKLDQLIAVLPHPVEIEIAVRGGAVLDVHLAVCTEIIVAHLQVGAFQKPSAEIKAALLGVLISVADEIIAPFILDQLVASLSHPVEVEVAICVRTIRDGHLAICIEVIVAYLQAGARQEGSIQIQRNVSGILVGVTDKVVISLILNQFVAGLLYAVQIEISVRIGSVLDGHDPIAVKVIVSRRQTGSLHILIREEERNVSGVFIVVGDEIIVILESDQFVAVLLHPIQVEESVVIGSIGIDRGIDHPSVSAKTIEARQEQTVGAGDVVVANDCFAVAVDVIVILSLLHQAGGIGKAVFQIGGGSRADEDAGVIRARCVFAHQQAFLSELIQLRKAVGCPQQAITLESVALVVEGIGTAGDGRPDKVAGLVLGMGVVAGTVIVPISYAVILPYALNKAILEAVLDAAKAFSATDARIAFIEVVPLSRHLVPALGQDAVVGVVGPAFNGMQAGVVNGLAAVTGQLVAHHLEAVAGSRNRFCFPIAAQNTYKALFSCLGAGWRKDDFSLSILMLTGRRRFLKPVGGRGALRAALWTCRPNARFFPGLCRSNRSVLRQRLHRHNCEQHANCQRQANQSFHSFSSFVNLKCV